MASTKYIIQLLSLLCAVLCLFEGVFDTIIFPEPNLFSLLCRLMFNEKFLRMR